MTSNHVFINFLWIGFVDLFMCRKIKWINDRIIHVIIKAKIIQIEKNQLIRILLIYQLPQIKYIILFPMTGTYPVTHHSFSFAEFYTWLSKYRKFSTIVSVFSPPSLITSVRLTSFAVFVLGLNPKFWTAFSCSLFVKSSLFSP